MKDERRSAIIEILDRSGFVNAQELSAKFNVTSETIRRDLEYIEREGIAHRVHGGAVSVRGSAKESAYQQRKGEHSSEKKAIAAFAAEMVSAGDTVLLAPGTTTLEVASFLRDKQDVTIITNSLPVAMELADSSGLNVFCLGGFLRAEDYSVSGVMALENLKVFNANKLITGIGGITLEHGLTDYRMDESALLRTFIDKAECVIGIADRSKFGKVLRYNICPAEKLTHLITDAETPKELYQPYEDAGVQIHLAPASEK